MAVTSWTLNSGTTVIDPVADTFTFAGSITTGGGARAENFIELRITWAGGPAEPIIVRVPQTGDVSPNATTPFNVGITSTSNPALFTQLNTIPVGANITITATAGTADTPLAGSFSETALCFMPGTLIATPNGEVAVESLKAGDLVLTAGGAAVPVRWMGRQTVAAQFAPHNLPIRIAAGALGEGLPKRDLLVSPGHALFVDGILVAAAALVNGTTIRQEADVPATFTYHHVEVAEHVLLLAEGAPAESFVDNAPRQAYDNWAEHAALFGNAPIAEMALPRASSARQVPAATRARLDAIAAELAGTVRQAA